jgi:hypothetical protein
MFEKNSPVVALMVAAGPEAKEKTPPVGTTKDGKYDLETQN